MSFLQSLLFFIISLLASIIGAICGIGGGIIIKPALDVFGWCNISTISFLSSCTVLSMSLYAVLRAFRARTVQVDVAIGTPLAIGAALGGVAGSYLFDWVKGLFQRSDAMGGVQAICLAFVTIGTLIYMIRKEHIRVLHLTGKPLCLAIGLSLGMLSSFLGIGGGPINLIVLFYCFGMNTKTAAINSLYIILFSQMTNIATRLLSGGAPDFKWHTLVLMIAGGLIGGIIGRGINKHLSSKTVDRLFRLLMVVIILICCFNIIKYLMPSSV